MLWLNRKFKISKEVKERIEKLLDKLDVVFVEEENI